MKICDCCKRVNEGYCVYCPENDKNGNKQEDKLKEDKLK